MYFPLDDRNTLIFIFVSDVMFCGFGTSHVESLQLLNIRLFDATRTPHTLKCDERKTIASNVKKKNQSQIDRNEMSVNRHGHCVIGIHTNPLHIFSFISN